MFGFYALVLYTIGFIWHAISASVFRFPLAIDVVFVGHFTTYLVGSTVVC